MRPLLALSVAAAVAAGSVAAASPALADTAGSSYSAAAKVASATAIAPVVQTSGAAAVLSPILDTVVNPIVSNLASLSSTVVSSTVNGLIGSSFTAGTPSGSQSATKSSACSGLQAGTCYNAASAGVLVPPLITVSLGTVQGYTASSPSYAGYASVSSSGINLLGQSLVSTGVVTSQTTCGAGATSCTTTPSAANVMVNQVAVAVPSTTSVPLTGSQLLSGLGLGSLLSSVPGVSLSASSATLSVHVESASSASTGSAETWGLRVTVDLSASLTISVGLASATISLASGGSTPNVLDLRLADTTASAGTASTGSSWVPPGLT